MTKSTFDVSAKIKRSPEGSHKKIRKRSFKDVNNDDLFGFYEDKKKEKKSMAKSLRFHNVNGKTK